MIIYVILIIFLGRLMRIIKQIKKHFICRETQEENKVNTYWIVSIILFIVGFISNMGIWKENKEIYGDDLTHS